MKKLSLLLFAAAFAVCASAAVPVKLTHKVVNPKMVLNTENVQVEKTIAKAPVTEQPAGEAVTYKRSGDYAGITSGSNIGLNTQSGPTTFVYAEDGTTVWIKNLLAGSGGYFGDAWVSGTLNAEGTLLTVPLGQSIYYSTQYSADVVLAWGKTTTDGEKLNFERDATVTEVTYTVDPDAKTFTLNNTVAPAEEATGADAFLATGLSCYWTDDDSWGGFIEWNTVFTESDGFVPTIITEQPEGELVSYQRSGDNISSSFFGLAVSKQDGKLNVVFAEEGKAYIQNPLWSSAATWVAGEYDATTGIITVPVGQYLTWNATNEYGVQLFWGSTSVETTTDPETGESSNSLKYAPSNDVSFQFHVDEENKTIELLNTIGDAEAEFPNNYVATGLLGLWSDDQTFVGIDFNTYGEVINLVPAVPADPILDEDAWYDSKKADGFTCLDFTLPTTDVDGNSIDPEYLSYSIFLDDETEPFVFEAATYDHDLTEDITEVTYAIYNDGYDFSNNRVYFYFTNEGETPVFTKRIGIQAIYTVPVEVDTPAPKKAQTFVTNKSNIVYYNLPPTAIDSITAKPEANGQRYNILGQPVDSNYRGFVIQNGKKFIVR